MIAWAFVLFRLFQNRKLHAHQANWLSAPFFRKTGMTAEELPA